MLEENGPQATSEMTPDEICHADSPSVPLCHGEQETGIRNHDHTTSVVAQVPYGQKEVSFSEKVSSESHSLVATPDERGTTHQNKLLENELLSESGDSKENTVPQKHFVGNVKSEMPVAIVEEADTREITIRNDLAPSETDGEPSDVLQGTNNRENMEQIASVEIEQCGESVLGLQNSRSSTRNPKNDELESETLGRKTAFLQDANDREVEPPNEKVQPDTCRERDTVLQEIEGKAINKENQPVTSVVSKENGPILQDIENETTTYQNDSVEKSQAMDESTQQNDAMEHKLADGDEFIVLGHNEEEVTVDREFVNQETSKGNNSVLVTPDNGRATEEEPIQKENSEKHVEPLQDEKIGLSNHCLVKYRSVPEHNNESRRTTSTLDEDSFTSDQEDTVNKHANSALEEWDETEANEPTSNQGTCDENKESGYPGEEKCDSVCRSILKSITISDKIKDKGTTRESQKVSFDTVEVRHYSMQLGDHPNCSIGAPVSLSWNFEAEHPRCIDSFESVRRSQRKARCGLLSFYQRRDILKEAGYTDEQLDTAEHERRKVQRQRHGTRMLLPFAKVEEAWQSTRRKVKRMTCRCSKDDSCGRQSGNA